MSESKKKKNRRDPPKFDLQTQKKRLHLDLDLLLESVLGNGLEGLLDVDGLLGRGFKVSKVHGIAKGIINTNTGYMSGQFAEKIVLGS